MKGWATTISHSAKDEKFMRVALEAAEHAALRGDVPVGAVVVKDGEIISSGENQKSLDPTAHAEIRAIRSACEKLSSWNLSGCTLYVTLEPCPMCAGAIVQARLSRVVFGACDPKAGAAGTLFDILRDTRLNHNCKISSGVLENECAAILKNYFIKRRISMRGNEANYD